jgi:hypothetical protein
LEIIFSFWIGARGIIFKMKNSPFFYNPPPRRVVAILPGLSCGQVCFLSLIIDPIAPPAT